MNPAEISAALQAAFQQCEAAGNPLSDRQRQILLAAVKRIMSLHSRGVTTLETEEASFLSIDASDALSSPVWQSMNPLDALDAAQREALLSYVKQQTRLERDWKIELLNDWLAGRDSGSVQFVRDRLGSRWLEAVQPAHLAAYVDVLPDELLELRVGDRIEVCNALWEWVPRQDDGTERQWYPCQVIQIQDRDDDQRRCTCCTIRFDDGAEYEIQGIYDWNRTNWRRLGQTA